MRKASSRSRGRKGSRRMKEWIERVRGTPSVCAKWVMLATAVGSVVGVMGVVFHFAVEIATHQRMEHPWLLLLLPLGGVFDCPAVPENRNGKGYGYQHHPGGGARGTAAAAADCSADFYQHRPDPSAGRFLRQGGRSFADWWQSGFQDGRLALVG